MIDRFTLYSSNLLPTATDTTHTATRVFGGINAGLTFASQISQMETLRSESTFGTLLRGLQVYGYKVLDGTALVNLYITLTNLKSSSTTVMFSNSPVIEDIRGGK